MYSYVNSAAFLLRKETFETGDTSIYGKMHNLKEDFCVKQSKVRHANAHTRLFHNNRGHYVANWWSLLSLRRN